MPITSKFLRDIRESAEADVPTHPSDAAVQLPDSLPAKKQAKEMDENLESDLPVHDSDAGVQLPDHLSEEDEDEDEKDMMSEEEDEDEKEISEEEEEEKDMMSEEEDEDEKDMMSEEEDEDEKEISEEEEDEDEEEEKDMMSEEEEKEISEEDEEEKEISEEEDEEEEKDMMSEEDGELEDSEKKKLEEQDDEEVKDAADALTKHENLPESFKKKVSSIFEAAVKRSAKRRALAEKKKIVESYNKKLKITKRKVSETLVNKVDGYLDYVVEEWMKENKVAIETSLRSDITDNFISGLKELFENHYIEVPVKKRNVLAEQQKKIEKLEKELNEQINKSVKLRKQNMSLKKHAIVKKFAEGMTISDAAKFSELCEGVSFDDVSTFGQKLKVIKESYFPKISKVSRHDMDGSLLVEGGLKYEEPKTVSTEVDIFADTISRMARK